MPETYTPITFVNDSAPPLNATNLNSTQVGIKTIDTRVAKLEIGADTPVVLTYAASLTINATQGALFRVTATGNLTIADITGGVNGQEITLEVLASSADRTLTFGVGSPVFTTITSGQWWSGSFRYNSGLDTWLFSDADGGSYSDEQAQDVAASLLTTGVHSGISFTYNDASNRVDATVTASGGAEVTPRGIYLDSFTGTDDDKLTSAIAAQQAAAGMPPMVLGARSHTFNQVRTLYSGLKLVGSSPSGPKNWEQDPNFIPSKCTLGTSITNGAASWWVTPGGNIFDVFMADFAVRPSSSSRTNVQFMDVTTGSLYACEFRSLAGDFMAGMFGTGSTRKCLITQVTFSGHWSVTNVWDTCFYLGGADNTLWMQGYLNTGTGSGASQSGTYGDYLVRFDSLGKTNVGYMFLNCHNGYRGLRITGSVGGGLQLFGGTYEGVAGTTSLTAGGCHGSVIRIEGGSGAFFGPNVGQAMINADPAEGGFIHQTAGEWNFYSPNFYRTPTAETVPMLFHAGGRCMVTGATRTMSETWTGRPRFDTSATAGAGTSSFYCPDQSMTA